MSRVRTFGFTLVELTVVLVIVALLIGGLLVPLSTQQDIRNRQEAEKSLAEIKEALIGFAAINGRLPCPADRTSATGTAGAGTEAVTGVGGPCSCTAATSGIAGAGATCNDAGPDSVTGVLPWATLGLRESDPWGQRYTYRVTTRFGRLANGQTEFACTPASNPVTASFALCSQGDMTIQISTGGTAIASNVPAIIVSHGRNGVGGFRTTGAQILGAAGDELENSDGDVDFVSKSAIDDSANYYDDLTVWVTTNVLMNRMIAVGRLP